MVDVGLIQRIKAPSPLGEGVLYRGKAPKLKSYCFAERK